MTTRINKKLVTFKNPFTIDDIDIELPAGNYTIETEEESIEGLTFLAFRRLETILVARPIKSRRGPTRYYAIHPESLERALASDAEKSSAQTAASTEGETTPHSRTGIPRA